MAEMGRAIARYYIEHVLLSYQVRWLRDRSPYRVGRWARQTGKSFIEALDSALEAAFGGINQYHFAASQRQSFEVLRKVKQHLTAIQALLDMECKERRLECVSLLPRRGKKSESKIELANGAMIEAFPANPNTTRGYTGRLRWDEAALTPRDREFWRGVLPFTTRGLKVSVTSTPMGDRGKFYEFCTKDTGVWSRHTVTIDDAIRAGMKVDIDALKAALDDPDAVAQEFYCEFLSDAESYFPSDMLRQVQYDLDAFPHHGPCYLGIDIGRKKDLTSVNVMRESDGIHYHAPAEVLRKAAYDAQESCIIETMGQYDIRRGLIDATGIGSQLAERMALKFPGVLEGVDFTAKLKHDLCTTMRRRLEQGTSKLPMIDQDLIRSLHSIRKNVSDSGNVLFDSSRQEGLGHADRAWGAMLAEKAAKVAGPRADWWS